MDIKNLKTKHYQLKIDEPGAVVTDLADIEQCIDVIFNIPKGSCPFLLNLGADIIDAIGQPPAIAEKIIKTVLTKELPVQEPRAEITNVKTTANADGKMAVKVDFKSKLTDEERTKTYYV